MKHTKIFSSPPAAPGFDRHLAAAYCGVSVRLLDHWRANGAGPEFFYIGSTPRYWPAALDRYINGHPALKQKSDLFRNACPYDFDAHFGLVPAHGEILLPHELADRLGVCKRTLNYWRAWGRGPAFSATGSHVTYTGTSVRAYLKYDDQQLGGAES